VAASPTGSASGCRGPSSPASASASPSRPSARPRSATSPTTASLPPAPSTPPSARSAPSSAPRSSSPSSANRRRSPPHYTSPTPPTSSLFSRRLLRVARPSCWRRDCARAGESPAGKSSWSARWRPVMSHAPV